MHPADQCCGAAGGTTTANSALSPPIQVRDQVFRIIDRSDSGRLDILHSTVVLASSVMVLYIILPAVLVRNLH